MFQSGHESGNVKRGFPCKKRRVFQRIRRKHRAVAKRKYRVDSDVVECGRRIGNSAKADNRCVRIHFRAACNAGGKLSVRGLSVAFALACYYGIGVFHKRIESVKFEYIFRTWAEHTAAQREPESKPSGGSRSGSLGKIAAGLQALEQKLLQPRS